MLADFHECGCLALIWQLFPGGVWIDPYVCEELKAKYSLDVQHALAHLQLPYTFTNDYEPQHYAEMQEIKTRRRALKHADISCVIQARLQQATCLSADNAVCKTCQERGIKVSQHGGILEEAVNRNLISKAQARLFFRPFSTSA
ncbi:hypothetical protein [Candidatus Pantoea deserta]|uniref:hypothetical protein n=1 Tax=Candidatus Pantoea deserta TaxID=1869313 RepID=UPI001F44ED58|nr:hypothetical protein [Pantoea deserta]